MGTWAGAGFLTGSNRQIQFSLPCVKIVPSNATIEAKITIRQNGNYLVGNGSSGVSVTLSGTNQGNNSLYIVHSYDSSIGGINNDTIGILLQGIKITFN